MPKPSRSRILSHAAGIAATIGVGMIPLHRLPRPVQTGYVVLPAAFTSAFVLLALQRAAPRPAEVEGDGEGENKREGGSSSGPGMRTLRGSALSLALGGAVAGVGAASICLDRGIENLLRRRGVPAPRVMMGLASGTLMLGMNVLEARASSSSEDGHGDRGSDRSSAESA